MADTNNDLLIPTAPSSNFRGSRILSQNALDAAQVYYQRNAIYGAPSLVPATGVVRGPVPAAVSVYTEHPAWNQYDHNVVWLGNTNGGYAAPIGYNVAAQKARTFGGVSAPYYQALKAPSVSDVAQFMGGLVNQNGR